MGGRRGLWRATRAVAVESELIVLGERFVFEEKFVEVVRVVALLGWNWLDLELSEVAVVV